MQRRTGLGPAAFDIQGGLAGVVEGHLVQLRVLVEFGLGDRTELIARQRRHGFAQRAYIGLAAQTVAGGRRAVEVTAIDPMRAVSSGDSGALLPLSPGQALWEEILDQNS